MSRLIEVDYAGEGLLDAAAARRVITAVGLVPGQDYVSGQRTKGQRTKGKDALRARLRGLAAGARFRPMLVLRDLDQDAACAGELVAALWRDVVNTPRHDGLLLRVAVRSLEAWLLADAAAVAKHVGCAVADVPAAPEELADAKASLIAVLRASPSRALREELGLRRGSREHEWPRIARWVDGFIVDHWQPRRASRRSPSLRRCLTALSRLPKA